MIYEIKQTGFSPLMFSYTNIGVNNGMINTSNNSFLMDFMENNLLSIEETIDIDVEEMEPTKELYHKEKLINKIGNLSNDGNLISNEVKDNVILILNNLKSDAISRLSEDDIILENNGTVTIEWYESEYTFISIEIGEKGVSVNPIVNNQQKLSKHYDKYHFKELISMLNGYLTYLI